MINKCLSYIKLLRCFLTRGFFSTTMTLYIYLLDCARDTKMKNAESMIFFKALLCIKCPYIMIKNIIQRCYIYTSLSLLFRRHQSIFLQSYQLNINFVPNLLNICIFFIVIVRIYVIIY